MRLAILATPRSGSNWLQRLLSRVYDLPRPVTTSTSVVPWDSLPRECVLILHWRREPAFADKLKAHGFQVIALARHPLDVLLSILRFTLFDPTDVWLNGAGGDERSILGVHPRSPAFLDYATGPRAAALLAVSQEWWHDPNTLRVRYEELSTDPAAQLETLVKRLGVPRSRRQIRSAVKEATLPRMRRLHRDRSFHFWQGRPGLWRELLTVQEADRIAAAHADVVHALGYDRTADQSLTAKEADRNWLRAIGAKSLEGPANVERRTAQAAIEELKSRLQEAQARLDRLNSPKSWSSALARPLRRLAAHFFKAAAVTNLH